MRFDEKSIGRLELPEGKREVMVFDDNLPGFGIRLRDGGKKTWILQYRVGRQQRRKTLGTPKELSLRAAREQAKADLAKVRLGGDPQKDKADARRRHDDTLESMAVRFLRRQRSELKPRSYEQVELHLTKHWAPLNSVSIRGITRSDIASQLGKIAEGRGPYAANRARATLSSFYSWAIGEGVCDANPTIGTNRNDEAKRDRVLSDDELVAIWRACRDDDYGRIVRLLLLTGQRRDEVGGMTRTEVDLKARKWSLPSERTKNSQPHEVPLSDAAIDILEPAIRRAGDLDHELVFGVRGERGFKGWGKAKLALDRRITASSKKQSEAKPWRLHDLRRTAATRMGDLGVLPHVVESALNHISGSKAGVAGTYNRALYWPEKRQALDLWAAHVEALLEGRLMSNVIPMRTA
jgi:integrase